MTEHPGDQPDGADGADEILALVADHERWLASSSQGRKLELYDRSFRGVDLSGRDLSEAWLSDCDLTGAQLRGAWLVRTHLLGCRLDGADLTGARMIRCDVSESSARGCTLTGANLTRAEFRDADLTGADLGRTLLCKTKFDGADLTGAVLRDADLDRTFLDGARLVGADVTGIAGTVISGRTYLTDGDQRADDAELLQWLRQNASGQVEVFDVDEPRHRTPPHWRWPAAGRAAPRPAAPRLTATGQVIGGQRPTAGTAARRARAAPSGRPRGRWSPTP